jgi:parallel beta-helix repeat protein
MFTLSRTSAFLLSVMLLGTVAQPATYHVSPNGADSNNGTSPATAWRSIARVLQSIYSLQPGDRILFERGGTYRGELIMPNSGNSANPIQFGAYGTGALPVISGSDVVTGWVQHSGNIWRAPLTSGAKHVYVNGVRQTLARFPNTGWLRNDQGTGTTLYDNALTQGSGYWNGSTVVIRSTNWSYDAPTVSGFSNGTLTFPNIYYNLGSNDWGYFLCNKLSELDAPGEWYHDATNGQLYLWAPNNANPNTLTVEAAIRDRGINVYWSRQFVTIADLAFQHQRLAGVWLDGASNVTITGCTFRELYFGIRSVGTNCLYQGNTFHDTYATAAMMLDNGSQFTSNTLTNIAMVPGLGESNWGYFGVRTVGNNNIVRLNRIENVGYIGIVVDKNVLVEKNVVRNPTAILNDGGGIAFDNCDGAIIQDNMVLDAVGSIESAAPNFIPSGKICHGIYFGNTVIKNTVVQRNTVSNCQGSGLHVDHTMVSTGNQIRDNVLFNNKVQLSVSDYSNYNGPGATAPYHVATFNGVYSGNVLYAAGADQLCMKQYSVYSPNAVDYGTFSNNKYFSPYEELSILWFNTNSGVQKLFTLERWQLERSEDAGSTRSPLRSSMYTTLSEISGNLMTSGTFDANVAGWGGWPTNAQVTRDLTYLDNGALKAFLPNNNVYPEFSMRSPDLFSVQNGQWYRMRFSIQSNVHGVVRAGVKGSTQLTSGNTIHERKVPFDGQRRDMEFYFQSTLTDQGMAQFINTYTEPQYWLDNVQVHRVQVQPVVPLQDHVLLVNDQATPQVLSIPTGCWSDVNGVVQGATATIPAFGSKVIYRIVGSGCNVVSQHTVGAKVFLGGALNWGGGVMRSDLRSLGLIPTVEPYTALGLSLENAGATVTSTMLQVTGDQAIVDWVVLELRNADAGYSVAARKAALVKANGEVISTDGTSQVLFSVPTAGKHLVIRHRNHLPAMTAAPLSANAAVVDMTSLNTTLYGIDPLQTESGKRALWPGDVNGNGAIKYTGLVNDRDPVLVAIGSVIPSSTVQGYRAEDINLDGWTKYSGAGNDRDFILYSVGGSVPTTVRLGQLP